MRAPIILIIGLAFISILPSVKSQGDCGISGILSIQDPAPCGCGSSCFPIYCTPVASGNCSRQLVSVFVDIPPCQNGTVIAETINCNGTASGLDYGDFCQVGTTRMDGINNRIIYIEECQATGSGEYKPVAITLSADRKDEIIEYRLVCTEHYGGCPGHVPPCSGYLALEISNWSIEAGMPTRLYWSTTNSPYVVRWKITRSPNGIHWDTIGVIKNRAGVTEYKYLDYNPMYGSNYFRLVEFHTNKDVEISPILHFDNKQNHKTHFGSAYSIGGILHITYQATDENERGYLVISDMTGREWIKKKIEIRNGVNQYHINVADLPYGIYNIIILHNGVPIIKRVII